MGDPGDSADQVEQAWIEEAKSRLAEIERGNVKTVPWSEARDRIFADRSFNLRPSSSALRDRNG
jgi:Putative addiction module component